MNTRTNKLVTWLDAHLAREIMGCIIYLLMIGAMMETL